MRQNHLVVTQKVDLPKTTRHIIINSASLEVAAKDDKVRTDKKDSKKLAKQLSDGNLTGIHIPSQERELSRLLTRTREQLVKERSRVGIKIKSRMSYFCYIGSHNVVDGIRF